MNRRHFCDELERDTPAYAANLMNHGSKLVNETSKLPVGRVGASPLHPQPGDHAPHLQWPLACNCLIRRSRSRRAIRSTTCTRSGWRLKKSR